MEMIVEKKPGRRKTEIALLWLIIAIGAVLMPTGIGLYLNVGKLAITEYASAIAARNFMVAEVKVLSNLGRALGIAFSLSGIAVIIMARDRLFLAESSHRMA